MDRGFNVLLYRDFYKIDETAVREYQRDERRKVEDLSAYVLEADTIDAQTVIKKIFPHQNVDVFISHSHDDRDLATQLAIDLKEKLGIIAFVDSSVWGSADDLLRKIDDKHCWDADLGIYRYSDRNRTTAHVHMILATALQQMIDRADTLFFLNTDKSLSTKHSVKSSEKTLSPWIHMELMFSSMVRTKLRPSLEHKRMMDSVHGSVAHEAPLKHLTALGHYDLVVWMVKAAGLRGKAAINVLYNDH
ncbi:hypothetical protein [Pseudomonas sp. HY13-MNA-CIBAN-0226]|uniref:hypothetical protein n=1 Tax=Pseudomonas sp. HY13-MNA-CIBAN-0226 TaxID=3140473 RepID=UPI003331E708